MSDNPAPRILAIAENLEQLVMGYRARKIAVGATNEAIDHVAGLAAGHCGKLLAPVAKPLKIFGPVSLPALNGSLGVALAIIEVVPADQVSRRHDYVTLRKPRHGGRSPRRPAEPDAA